MARVELDLSPAWILSDGAAGNRRPAQALAQALGLHADEWILHTQAPWRWLAPHLLPRNPGRFAQGIDAALRQSPPRLAIGCGRQGALATRWLRARIPGCRAVQILDPRIDPGHFDAVLAPQHDRLSGANVLSFCAGLHAIDGPQLARARIDHAELAELPSPRVLVLLGGPHPGYALDLPRWHRLSAVLRQWQALEGGSVLLSSSRRTPAWLRDAARHELADLPGRQWHGEIDGANPYLGFLAWADRIVVTADSANMLAEACATAAPVLCPVDPPPSGKLASLYQQLLAQGRVRPLQAEFQAWNVQPLRETARLATELRGLLAKGA